MTTTVSKDFTLTRIPILMYLQRLHINKNTHTDVLAKLHINKNTHTDVLAKTSY